jgi:hypothetical protein
MTLDEVMDDLVEYADFEEVGSVSRAKSYITAANRYFILSPSSQSSQGGSMAMDMSKIQTTLDRAHAFVAANQTPSSATTSQVRYLKVSRG